MTVIRDAEKLASYSSGKEININKINFDDKAVLDSIGTGKTDGVFQLGECRNEELYERAETAEPGRYYRRNFPVSSGGRWILSLSILKEKNIRS